MKILEEKAQVELAYVLLVQLASDVRLPDEERTEIVRLLEEEE